MEVTIELIREMLRENSISRWDLSRNSYYIITTTKGDQLTVTRNTYLFFFKRYVGSYYSLQGDCFFGVTKNVTNPEEAYQLLEQTFNNILNN